MLDAVKRYVAGIILLHVVLLVILVLVVLWASRQVQTSARVQAQASKQEELRTLADQTARGIETQYNSILQNLDVVLREQSAATAPGTTSPAATQEAPARGLLLGRGRGGAGAGRGGQGRGGIRPRIDLTQPLNINVQTLTQLYRQLDGRVSQLFLVNLNTHAVALSIPDSAPAITTATALMGENIDWLRKLKVADMSTFVASGAGTEGYHLIAVPAVDVGVGLGGTGNGRGAGAGGFGEGSGGSGGGPGGPGGFGGRGPGGGPGPGGFGGGPGPAATGGLPGAPPQELAAQFAVVVVVPIEKAREQFLDNLNGQQTVSAILVNDRGQVLTSTRLQPGTNLFEQLDETARPRFQDLVSTERTDPASIVIDQPFMLAGEKTEPLILASAQLEVPSGRHWTVLIGSGLADAETVVNKVFGTALLGAIFVSIAVAAILASTSFFLIRARVRLEQTRTELLTRELQQARQIQLAWLPDMKSVPAGIEVSAVNLPASHISGDFYNWFPLPPIMQKTGVGPDSAEGQSGRVAIVIGDVTGHGMAAAFLMATTQLLVRLNLTRYQDAGRCLREVNRQLCIQSGGGFRGQFVTMLIIVLDTLNNRIQVASAGHPPPLLETDGTFQPLAVEPQLVLGVNADEDYTSRTYGLDVGASVILYTDGVVETESADGRQYGADRLLKLLQSVRDAQPSDRIRAILEDVKRYAGGREIHDDLTLVAIRTVPTEASVGA